MKAKVIKRFRDKNDQKKVYGKNKVFEGTKERVAELQKLGFLGDEIAEKKKSPKEGE